MPSIPTATVSRLVTYLRILSRLERDAVPKVSSAHLAEEAQVTAFQVRKDLAYFGRFGTRGAGYSVPTLHAKIRRILGLTGPRHVAIVGMGRLGEALVDYPSLEQYDFVLDAGFDVDPAKVGRTVGSVRVHHLDDLPRVVRERNIEIGFLTVPPAAAQTAANALVDANVKGILNFAPTVIETPDHVHVEPVDFLAGLKRLSFYIRDPEVKEEFA